MQLRDLLLVGCSVGLSIPSTLIINHFIAMPPSLVSFDLKGAVARYSAALAKQSLSDDEIADKTAAFSQHLEQTLERYSQTNHAVVLVQGATLFGIESIDRPIERALNPHP